MGALGFNFIWLDGINSNRDVLNITSGVVCSDGVNYSMSVFFDGSWII